MHRPSYRLGYSLALLLLVLAACTQRPLIQIVFFTASDTTVTAGTDVTLSWEVSNFDSLTLTASTGEMIDVTGETSITRAPQTSTTYTLTASRGGSQESQTLEVVVGQAPTVESFAFQPASVSPGEEATLSWNVSNADSVTIDPDIGRQNPQGSTTVSKSAQGAYTYTLTAENEFGAKTDTATLVVGAGPAIESFTATPTELPDGGGAVTLRWEIGEYEGDLSLTLSDGADEINVTGDSSARVSVEESTTFTLSATDDEGTSTASVTVAVGDRPAITVFEASDTTVTAGAPVVLTWGVASGTPVTLTLNGEPVSGNSTTVQPETTTTYTLRAVNEDGEDSESITINVGAAPVISSFTASEDAVSSGAEVTLSWSVTGAETLSISPGIGEVTGSSRTVTVTSTTTYTLTARNDFGTATRTAQVRVGSPPVINAFSVSPSTPIEEGESATLNWTVRGEDITSVSIDKGVGEVATSGSQSVSPNVTTTYTLTVTSPFGTATRSVTVVVRSGDRITLLIAGQSNAVGQGELDNPESPIPQVRMLGNDYVWKTATEPVDSSVNQVDAVSRDSAPGHSFGVRLGKELYYETGSDVYLIPSARGASCLTSACNTAYWKPFGATDRSTLFGSAVYRAKVSAGAVSNPPNGADSEGGPITGIIWYQGESDAQNDSRKTNFISNTREVMTKFRQNLGNVPIFYVQLGVRLLDPTENQLYQEIRERQRRMESSYGEAGSRLDDYFMVVAHDLPMVDQNHLSAAGQKELGERISLAYLEHVLGYDVDGTGPRIVSIEMESETTIKITTTSDELTEDTEGDSYSGYFLVYADRVAITSGVFVERHPSDSGALRITIPSGTTGSLAISYGPRAQTLPRPRVDNVVRDAESELPLPAFGDTFLGVDGELGLPVPYYAEIP